jgi:hypothetical protein
MLGLYAALGFAFAIMRRRFRREQPGLAAELDAQVSVRWYWRLLDGLAAVGFVFGPPLIVSLARPQPLSWESEFTGYHLLAMAGGISIYSVGRAYIIRRYRKQRHGPAKDAG